MVAALMRILHVIHDFIPEVRAGSELYAYYLALEQQRQGHTTLVFYPTWGLDRETRKNVDGVECLTFPNTSKPLGVFADFNAAVDETFANILAEFKPEIVHIHQLLYLSLNIVDLAKAAGAKVVYTIHDFWLLCPHISLLAYDNKICSRINHIKCVECCKRIVSLDTVKEFHSSRPAGPDALSQWEDRLEKNLKAFAYLHNRRPDFIRDHVFGGVDLFIAPSNFLRKKFIQNGMPPEKIVYLDYGMMDTVFAGLMRKPAARMRFGFIGSILHHKGVDVLIDAFNPIHDAELLVAGKIAPYNAKYAAMSCNPRIRFIGEIGEDRKKEFFESIDVLIVPSVWYENSPITIHEAYLAGIPAIVSDIGGMAELVRHMENGLQFAAGSAEDLRAKIRYFIDHPAECSRLAANHPGVQSIARHALTVEKLYGAVEAHKTTPADLAPIVSVADLRVAPYAGMPREEPAALFFARSTIDALRDAVAGTKKKTTPDGNIRIRRLAHGAPLRGAAVGVRFGDTAELAAFRSGFNEHGELELVYAWKKTGAVDENDMVFVHFCEGEKIVFQHDHAFLGRQFPLASWSDGETIEETYRIAADATALADKRLAVRLGVMRLPSLERARIADSRGLEMDDEGTRIMVGALTPSGPPAKIDVTVVMPTGNAIKEDVPATVRLIRSQDTRRNIEVIVLDSASTPESAAILEDAGAEVIAIDPTTFNHGLTRNLGVARARGEFIVLLVGDGRPADEHWLELMVRNFADPRVAGVFCRQIPRPEASVLTKRGLNNWVTGSLQRDVREITDRAAYDRMGPHERYLFCTFDNVCTCIRKSVWEQFPFPKTDWGEDLYFSRQTLEAGWKIVYEPEAAVIHSHDRSPLYEYRRTYIGHYRLHELFGIHNVPELKYVPKFTVQNILGDLKYLFANEPEWPRRWASAKKIPAHSFLSVYAQYKGARDRIAGRSISRQKGV